MSRTIKEIYNEAVAERNRRLELAEFASDSKLSVMNGILWVVAAAIYSFETLLDVFAVDISEAINGRINGTPAYYANALLQYQQGDVLFVAVIDGHFPERLMNCILRLTCRIKSVYVTVFHGCMFFISSSMC